MKKGTVMWKHNPYMKVNSVISADWHDSFWLQKCDAFYHSGGSIYKQKYEQGKRELEFTKQKIKQQHEEDKEQQQVLRKQLERKVGSIIKCLTFISITVSGSYLWPRRVHIYDRVRFISMTASGSYLWPCQVHIYDRVRFISMTASGSYLWPCQVHIYDRVGFISMTASGSYLWPRRVHIYDRVRFISMTASGWLSGSCVRLSCAKLTR